MTTTFHKRTCQEIWVATGNQGKLKEIKNILSELEYDIHSQAELSFFTPQDETGDTFEDNARVKAQTLAAVKENVWILGEDSGLEVEGLERMPGIYSARYAGENASDVENTAKILQMLKIRSPLNRKAQFVTSLVVISPDGKESVFSGVLEGTIAIRQTGHQGFGYDPIFIPNNETQTLAELGNAYKNKISHRAKATRKFLDHLKPEHTNFI